MTSETKQHNGFTEYEITDLKNFLKPYLNPEKLSFLLNAIQIRQHILKMIDRCNLEMDKCLVGNKNSQPKTMPDNIWSDIQEQRYEYLSNLKSKLVFMIDHPEEEQNV